MSRPRLIALLLALGTLLVYLPATQSAFLIFDDDDYVTGNFVVQNGLTWHGIAWAFTTYYASNWHPLTWISHEMDCQFFGLNAGMHHFINVAFHLINALLLFSLLLRLTRGRSGTKSSVWPSAFVAALFAWHPLHVESVAWISERKDVLSTFFELLSLLAYVRFVEAKDFPGNKAKIFYAAALLMFAFGLMSKAMVVTTPFVMLLLDFWPLGRMEPQGAKNLKSFRSQIGILIAEKIPLFVLAIGCCVLTCLAQSHGGMVVSLERLPFANRVAFALQAYLDYLSKIFCPIHLSIFYPLPKSISPLATGCAFLVLIFVSAISWHLRKTRPYLLVGWLWFLGTLVPVIGLVQVGAAAMADRYSYFPSVGIFLMVAWGTADIVQKYQTRGMRLAVLASATILFFCLFLTREQLNYWRNSIALFSHAVQLAPANAALHGSLGLAFERAEEKTNALNEYHLSEKLEPNRAATHCSLAILLGSIGRFDDAVSEFQIALRLDPNRILTRNSFGSLLMKSGRLDEAEEEFAKSESLNANDWHAPFLMGQLRLREGRDVEAIPFFQRALRLDPDNYYVLNFFARVLASDKDAAVRDGQTALSLAQRANELSHGIQPSSLDTLAMAEAELGDFSNAIKTAQFARDLAVAFEETNEIVGIDQRLKLYRNGQAFRQSFLEISEKEQP